MTVCSGLFTCDGFVELIAVTFVSFAPIVYFSVRYDRSVLLALGYGLLSLLAFPISFLLNVLFYFLTLPFTNSLYYVFSAFGGSVLRSIGYNAYLWLPFSIVALLFGVLGFLAWRSLQSTFRSMLRLAAAFCFGIIAGWIAAGFGSLIAHRIWFA